MEVLGGLIGLVVGAALYFLPTILAVSRNHHQTGPIAVINTFLGWTLIGWVVALAMAASKTDGKPQVLQAKCSECGATNSPAARFCSICGVAFEGVDAQ